MSRADKLVALELLYVYNKGLVFDALEKFEEDYEARRDLVQDVYVRCVEKIDSFEGKSELSTWVHRVAVNLGIDHVKEQVRDKRSNEVLASALEAGVDEYEGVDYYDRWDVSEHSKESAMLTCPSLEVEAEEAYDNATRQMPDRMASCVDLRRSGHSNPEIAEILNVSLTNVETIITRSKKYFIPECENTEFMSSNSVRASEDERKYSLLDWANRAVPLPKRASMLDITTQQRDRYRTAEKALRLRKERIEGSTS